MALLKKKEQLAVGGLLDDVQVVEGNLHDNVKVDNGILLLRIYKGSGGM